MIILRLNKSWNRIFLNFVLKTDNILTNLSTKFVRTELNFFIFLNCKTNLKWLEWLLYDVCAIIVGPTYSYVRVPYLLVD